MEEHHICPMWSGIYLDQHFPEDFPQNASPIVSIKGPYCPTNIGKTLGSTELSWFPYRVSFCANEQIAKLLFSQLFPQSISGGYCSAEQTLENADLGDLDRITNNNSFTYLRGHEVFIQASCVVLHKNSVRVIMLETRNFVPLGLLLILEPWGNRDLCV